MKKFLSLFMTIVLSISILSGCSSNDNDIDSSEVTDNTSVVSEDAIANQFKDEDESLKLETQEVEDSFFYGTWKGETDRAAYMYGNVTITINKDGTWDGNITDEDIHGKWKHKGRGLRLTSDVIPFNLVYSSNNNVVLQETDDAVRVVLTRQ